jgi:hypothetical protein
MFEGDFVASRLHAIDLLAHCVEGNISDGFQIHCYFTSILETGKVNIKE